MPPLQKTACTDVSRVVDEGGPDVSVIVPAVGEQAGLVRRCLEGLRDQKCELPREVLVVTERRGDVAGIVRRFFPDVRLVYCTSARGPGGARNEGIMAARGDYLVFIDGDCVPGRDWLRRLTAPCFEAQENLVNGWTVPGPYAQGWARAMVYAEIGRALPGRQVQAAGPLGSNMCVSRLLTRETGARFAEGVYGAEETNLMNDLPPERRNVLLEPEAKVTHIDLPTFCGSFRRMWNLGKGSGMVRRSGGVRGAFLARHLWAAPLIVPCRLVLSCWRLRHAGWKSRLDFLLLLPLVVTYWICYTAGFIIGAFVRGQQGEIKTL